MARCAAYTGGRSSRTGGSISIIAAFIVAHLGAILAGLTTVGATIWAMFERKSAQTVKAQAAASVAQAQQQVAEITQANADAQKVGSDTAAARAEIDNTLSAISNNESAMNGKIGLSLSLLVLTVCAATTACALALPAEVVTKTRVVDTSCDWVKPIYLDKTDVLSDTTAKAIFTHDQAGAKACNRKPLK